ncbi:MAG: type IV conjugative transfer system protein TraE [Legionellaceae bacterium]|nr:type IV conjugative transfer system protein TraE [Legionellaceae bacterium]
MNFNIQKHKLAKLVERFNLMVALVFSLLITNILMAGLAFYMGMHKQIEITPFFTNLSYSKSDIAVDNKYLTMMSENFLYLRLNISPETVSSHHKRLLDFVGNAQFADFSRQLEGEAKLIKTGQISSNFEISEIHPDSNSLTCLIRGVLKRSVGFRELKAEHITYKLQYKYRFGRLAIKKFMSIKENENA